MGLFDALKKKNSTDDAASVEQDSPAQNSPAQKEQERITLSLQMEDTERRYREDQLKRAKEMKEIQKNARQKMLETEKAGEKSAAMWNKKVSDKAAETDEFRNSSSVNEAQSYLETDRKKRAINAESEEIRKTVNELKDRFLQEKEKNSGKINSTNEEILALKTKIALRDAQRRVDEEKHSAEVREIRSRLDEQISAAERKITEQESLYKARLGQMENELIALKASADKKLSGISLDFEEYNAKMSAIKDRLNREIISIKDEIANETAAFRDELKKKDEEINKLKIEIMLAETQEKAEQEKMNALLKEEQEKAGGRIAEIEKKTESVKSNFEALIRAKNEELQAVKVNSELKLREHQKNINSKRKELSGIFDALNAEKQFIAEKLAKVAEENKEVIEARNQSAEALKNKYESARNAIKEKFESESNRLNSEIKTLTEQLESREREAAAEKTALEQRLLERDTEIYRGLKELGACEEANKKELVDAEKSFNESAAPIKHEIEKMKERMSKIRENAGRAAAEKEREIAGLASRYESELKQMDNSLELELKDISFERAGMIKEIEKTEAARQNAAGDFARQEKAKNDEIASIMAKMEELDSNLNARKQEITQEFVRRRKEIETERETLLRQVSAVEKEKAEFEKAAEAQKKLLEERFIEKQKEVERNFAIEREKNEREKESLRIEEETLKRKLSDEVRSFEDRIAFLESELKQNIFSAAEKEKEVSAQLRAIGEEIWVKREPLEKEIIAVREQIALKKREFSERVEDVEKSIAGLKNRITGFERESLQISAEREKEFSSEREKIKEEIFTVKSAIDSTRARNQRILDDKTAEIERAKNDFSARLAMMLDEQVRMQKEWASLKSELEKEAGGMQKEFDEISALLPQQLDSKYAEKEQLGKKIANREEDIAREASKFEKRLKTFKRRLALKLSSASVYLEAEVKAYEEKIKQKEDEISQARTEFLKKEERLLETIDGEATQFAQKRFDYEKEKERILTEKSRLEAQTLEKIRGTEKEIIALRQKTKLFEESWLSRKESLTAESARASEIFRRDMETIQQRIKAEEEMALAHLREKEVLNLRTAQEAAAKIKALTAKFAEQRKAHTEELPLLSGEINRIREDFEKTKAEKDALLKAKAAEAEKISAETAAREKEQENELEKIRRQYEDDIKSLEEKMSLSMRQLDLQEKEYTRRLNELDGQRAAMESDYSRRETSEVEKNVSQESVLKSRKQALENEIESWNGKLADLRKTFEHERGILEERLEKTRTALGVGNARHESERSRLEHGFRKDIQGIEEKISELKYKLMSGKRQWDDVLHLKEEEIKALQFRLNGRDSRIKDESRRRLDALSAIMSEFEKQVSLRREEFVKTSAEGEAQVKKYNEEIGKLKSEIAQRQEQWSQKKRHVVSNAEYGLKALESELDGLQKVFREKESSIKDILDKKEKQLEMLRGAILLKDAELTGESRRTSKESLFVRDELSEIRRNIRYPAAQNTDMQNAIRLFTEKDYRGAIKAFNEITMSQPHSAAAFEYLAVCYFELGLNDDAAKYARKTLQFDSDNIRAKNILSKIRRS